MGNTIASLLVLSFLACLLPCGFAETPDKIDFTKHIQPIISDRCVFCHGPDEADRKAKLRLDTFEGATAARGKKGDRFAIVPGKPDESELLTRIHSDDPDEQMPPPERGLTVTDEERALLRQWIEEGAEYKGHWAFESFAKPDVPSPADPDKWARNEIDQFVLAGLAKQDSQDGLKPQPVASAEQLLRRLSFDLTGLPPTLAELDQFTLDESDTEKTETPDQAIERLLASPHYGERMAVDWLDAARYADTYGFQVDRDRQVWPWRDWVVRAFNDNLPYDQFTTWQLAGDLLDNPTDDQLLATTFSRLHQQKVEGGSVEEEFRVEYVADRLHTFGTTFLGLTLECARCHDHKYDPISARNYYELFSFFQNIDEAGLYSYFTSSTPTPTLQLTNDDQKKRLAELNAAVAKAESELAGLDLAKRKAAFEKWKQQETNQVAKTVDETAGMVALYKFDEGKVGKHANAAKDGKEATTGGGNTVVEGKWGKALKLTGDDAVKLPVGNFKRHQPFSVSLWLNPASHYERAVVYHRSRAWTDAASRGYELLIEDGRLSAALIHFYPGNAIRVQAVDTLPTNTWTEVAVTYDGSSRAKGLKIHVNGKRAASEIVYDNLSREITGGGGDTIAIGERFRDKGFKYGLVDEFRVYTRELTASEITGKADPFDVWAATIDPEHKAKRDALAKARAARDNHEKSFREIMIMRETANKPAFILNRGMYDDPGEPVDMVTPEWLPPMPEGAPANRLGLARWLTQPEHPLTARVFVNRVWQMYFGEGLVRTPEDFGKQGALPTHPELLDWLAVTFIEDGWDIKALHRRILGSATYRQGSRASAELLRDDPENEWLARGPVFRRSAEMIRDNALFVSGLLDPKLGGGPVKAYDQEVSFKPAGRNKNTWRRSIYTYWRRNGPAPAMMALDAVKRDVCKVKREVTSSPLQALVLLNGPQFVEAARVGAEQLLAKDNGKDDALEQAFRQCTSRAPNEAEAAILKRMHEQQLEHFRANPEEAKKFNAIGDKAANKKTDPAELAALTTIFSALLNHDECVMRR